MLDQPIKDAIIRLYVRSAFFGSLAVRAKFCPSEHLFQAATDGLTIYYNPGYISLLSSTQLEAVLLHQLLHAVLLHVPQKLYRESQRWVLASEVVIRRILREVSGIEMPPCNPYVAAKGTTLEELYEDLLQKKVPHLSNQCLDPYELVEDAPPVQSLREQETYWRQAKIFALWNSQASLYKLTMQGFSFNSEEISQAKNEAQHLLWLYGRAEQAAVSAICAGQGQGVLFPEGVEEQFALVTLLCVQAKTHGEFLHALEWLEERGNPLWQSVFTAHAKGAST